MASQESPSAPLPACKATRASHRQAAARQRRAGVKEEDSREVGGEARCPPPRLSVLAARAVKGAGCSCRTPGGSVTPPRGGSRRTHLVGSLKPVRGSRFPAGSGLRLTFLLLPATWDLATAEMSSFLLCLSCSVVAVTILARQARVPRAHTCITASLQHFHDRLVSGPFTSVL